MDKLAIRKLMYERRENLKNRDVLDAVILEKAKNISAAHQTIALFYAFNHEVNTVPLISYLLEKGKTVACPVIKAGVMRFMKVESIQDFEMGHFNIMEPVSKIEIDPASFDLIWVPLLAFNNQCYRVGYGKGYYDRFLIQTKGLKVGLAYEVQFIDIAFEDEKDVACDFVVTEVRG